MNIVPEVPREMLHLPPPTAPVPTAAAALSPAPAQTTTSFLSPSRSAASGSSVPTRSKLSCSAGSQLSSTPQRAHISRLQRRCSTSSSSVPEASE